MANGSEPPLGMRPLDPARDLVSTLRTVRAETPPEVSRVLLTDVPEAFFAGVDDVLLAALGLAVASWHRGKVRDLPGVLIELEGHGRAEQAVPGADLSRTVGWFTSHYPVRLDLSGIDLDDAFAGGAAAGAMVKRTKETLRALPDRGLGYGLLRYLNPATGDELRRSPRPQIVFNYLGRYGQAGEAGAWSQSADFADLAGLSDPSAPAAAGLEITVLTEDTAAGPVLRASWTYPDGLFTRTEIDGLAAAWRAALGGLAAHVAQGETGGGHTPSDMPLVTVDQSTLDAFDERWRTP